MLTSLGHLTFCSNIFPGETWDDHFKSLQQYVPVIKRAVSPDKPFAIGLRLANQASLRLSEPGVLEAFRRWLKENDCYVFTVNGFPYGNFHHCRVKDQVHAPDWTTVERVAYTLRIARILATLLPEGMEGGVSTSPLSYKPWFGGDVAKLTAATASSTDHILEVVSGLHRLRLDTGKTIHLDIEPEAGGLIESWEEFHDWFVSHLLPRGVPHLEETLSTTEPLAREMIYDHVRLCYDVCHFAVGFEDMGRVLEELGTSGIRIGKWQLSAALKLRLSGNPGEDAARLEDIRRFDEPVYLHQVVEKTSGAIRRFEDLPEALQDAGATSGEWRSHFHVPLFLTSFGLLESTQPEVAEALKYQASRPYTTHLEVETYTWDVLPENLRLPVAQSVIRELDWVLAQIDANPKKLPHA
jgi:hypothetical protein